MKIWLIPLGILISWVAYAQEQEHKSLLKSASIGIHAGNLNGMGLNCNFMFSKYAGIDIIFGRRISNTFPLVAFDNNRANFNIRAIGEYKIAFLTAGWYTGTYVLNPPFFLYGSQVTETTFSVNAVCFSIGAQEPYKIFSVEFGIAPNMPEQIVVVKNIDGGTITMIETRHGNTPFKYLMIRLKIPLKTGKKERK